MSSDAVIEVRDLAKCYQIYEKPRDRLLQMIFGRFGRRFYREFWALEGLTFAIPKGRVYGILGRNGAGKSTLLQLLCGTVTPTHGEVRIEGRVAALLELGSGFNPEFTGIENVYMNAQLLGLSREEVDGKLGEILAFADIGDFAAQPVKTYSSGMFARLAFSVAIHVDPDVLIVDETLSVGDAWFQHKSMARMRRLMESGCTVLFVSHSIDAVRALCDQAIWLESGKVKMSGPVVEVTNAYMNDVFIEHNRIAREAAAEQVASVHGQSEAGIDGDAARGDEAADGPESAMITASTDVAVADQPGGNLPIAEAAAAGAFEETEFQGVLRVSRLAIEDGSGAETTKLEQGARFSIVARIQFAADLDNISIGFLVKDQFGQDLTGESIFNTRRAGVSVKAGQVLTARFSSKMALRGGQSYSLALRVNQVSRWDRADNVVIYADELALVFDVLSDPDKPMWFKFKLPFEVSVE